jgi:hypothetical protein
MWRGRGLARLTPARLQQHGGFIQAIAQRYGLQSPDDLPRNAVDRLRVPVYRRTLTKMIRGKNNSLSWPLPKRRMTPRLSPTPRTVSLREHAASPGGRQNGFQETALLHSFVCGPEL